MDIEETKPGEAANHEFTEIGQGVAQPDDTLEVNDLGRVRMEVTADLGSCQLSVREVLELTRGSLVALDKLAGEMTELRVNGLALARGEVVVIGDVLHVRIGEIVGQEERPGTIEAESDEGTTQE